MVSAEELEARIAALRESGDLTSLLLALEARTRPLLDRLPPMPTVKALLSTDGGVCPDDGTALRFDPWNANEHQCPTCGKRYAGERHLRAWARLQHLWLAERAAELATVAVASSDESLGERAGARSREILRWYAERYTDFPNVDNVLGPSRLFFSTYLESIFITNYMAAAVLLREGGAMDEETAELVGRLADEAAAVIGEFDEGYSNRQTWNSAALTAIAVWFEDAELAQRAIEGPTGILAHWLEGLGDDGMWYEGENYHLFALRGLLVGTSWARLAGMDLIADPQIANRLRLALRAPAVTALPDRTFPARKDSRFGISLAQPMYLELWEIGLAWLGEESGGLEAWLAELYAVPAPVAQTFESYLHEAGLPAPAQRTRTGLSWWALLQMEPVLRESAPGWAPASELLEGQGLAILRQGDRYASLECGEFGGGHGHPDRLHLTLFSGGVHWLPDFGTGSYVSPDLFWYRSTLAHNAPRLDGKSQPTGDARCAAFEAQEKWSWVVGRFGDLTRTLVAGQNYLVDLVELAGEDEHLLELPWHFAGAVSVEGAVEWQRGVLDDPFVTNVEASRRPEDKPLVMAVARPHGDGPGLRVHFLFEGELVRAEAPGAPGKGRASFLVQRAKGRRLRFLTLIDFGGGAAVTAMKFADDTLTVESSDGIDRHRMAGERWEILQDSGSTVLAGQRLAPASIAGLVPRTRPTPLIASAPWVDPEPALDGTLDGFDISEPIALDLEDQYRRSELPFEGPETFSAVAFANWNDDALFLAVEVTKSDPRFRPADAAPLRLDNEHDDIHSDGLQVYLTTSTGTSLGFLVVPDSATDGVRVRAIPGTAAEPDMIRGAWQLSDNGYTVTLAIRPPEWSPNRSGSAVDFDLIVNELGPERTRRSGQLVWSGGGGWIWLRGDRQETGRFGELRLVP